MSSAGEQPAGAREGEAIFMMRDDCWEPESAIEMLWRFAGHADRAIAATPHCLRVIAGSGGAIDVMPSHVQEAVVDTWVSGVSYIWVLWSGSPPSREDLVRACSEILGAVEVQGADEGGPDGA